MLVPLGGAVSPSSRVAASRRVSPRRLLPRLVRELSATKLAEEIRACTDAILSEFDESPGRSFVLPLAERRPAIASANRSAALLPAEACGRAR
jgi:hypothetical protein